MTIVYENSEPSILPVSIRNRTCASTCLVLVSTPSHSTGSKTMFLQCTTFLLIACPLPYIPAQRWLRFPTAPCAYPPLSVHIHCLCTSSLLPASTRRTPPLQVGTHRLSSSHTPPPPVHPPCFFSCSAQPWISSLLLVTCRCWGRAHHPSVSKVHLWRWILYSAETIIRGHRGVAPPTVYGGGFPEQRLFFLAILGDYQVHLML